MMTTNRSGRLLAFGAALAFASIAVLPGLVAMRTSPAFPTLAFSVDDGLYLQRAIGSCRGQDAYEWTYFESATRNDLSSVVLERPNAIVDVATGCIAGALSLSPGGFAIALDLVCGALSFLLFAAIFGCWTDRWTAMSAAVLATAFPHALVPEPVVLLPNALLPALVSQPFMDHAAAAFRAVYTQASYPFFLFAMLLLVRRFHAASLTLPRLGGIGLLCGLAGHGYFFPWLALLAIGSGLPVLAWLVSPAGSLRRAVAQTATFASGWFLGSLGVLFLIASNETQGIVRDAVIGRYWWFPLERLVLAAVLLVAAVRSRKHDPSGARLLGLMGLLLALELPLANVQPLLQQGMAPYHFPSFYLHPFVTGGLFVLAVSFLRSRFSFAALARAVLVLPLLALAVQSAIDVRRVLAPDPFVTDVAWLVRQLQQTPADSVFALDAAERPFDDAAPAFPLRNLPNFVATLSGRFTLYQEWMFNEMEDDSDLRREMAMSWLLSGTMRPLWLAPHPVPLPGDLFTLTLTDLQLRRRQKLEMHARLLRDHTVCGLLRDFRIDFLVHDTANDGPLADPQSRFLTPLATSPHGTFRIHRFDRARAIEEACTTETGARAAAYSPGRRASGAAWNNAPGRS